MNQRIAIITGGSRGLGRSMALHLAQTGVDIFFTYRADDDAARDTAAAIEALGARAHALQLDVADGTAYAGFAETVRTTLADWGTDGFDILVHNAGSGLHVPLMETTEAQFDSMTTIHVKPVLFLTQALAPQLRDGGRILNISSGLARFTLPGAGAYAAAKGAVEVLTRYLARELAPRRIAVNTLAPGAIATDFNGGGVRDNPQVNAWVASQTALGRAGLPDDIGGAAAAILAEANGWVTGQRIEASGGMML